jgi:hypothetical protein
MPDTALGQTRAAEQLSGELGWGFLCRRDGHLRPAGGAPPSRGTRIYVAGAFIAIGPRSSLAQTREGSTQPRRDRAGPHCCFTPRERASGSGRTRRSVLGSSGKATRPIQECCFHEPAALPRGPSRAPDAPASRANQPSRRALTRRPAWPLADKGDHQIRAGDVVPFAARRQPGRPPIARVADESGAAVFVWLAITLVACGFA